MKVLPSQYFTKGRWRNGMGTSWEIATDPEGSGDAGFRWRMALAQIDGSVPFSHYENIDRIFTLIKGDGLDLTLEGRPKLQIADCFVPHAFPGDVKTDCNLHGGPCVALNLFFDRLKFTASAQVFKLSKPSSFVATDTIIAFALRGSFELSSGSIMKCHDAVLLHDNEKMEFVIQEKNSLLYLVSLRPL